VLDGGGGKSRLEGLRSCGDTVLVGISKNQRNQVAGNSAATAPQPRSAQYQQQVAPWLAPTPPMWAVPLTSPSQVPFFTGQSHKSENRPPWSLLATAPQQPSVSLPGSPDAQDLGGLTVWEKQEEQMGGKSSVNEFVEGAVDEDSTSNVPFLSELGTPMKVDVALFESSVHV